MERDRKKVSGLTSIRFPSCVLTGEKAGSTEDQRSETVHSFSPNQPESTHRPTILAYIDLNIFSLYSAGCSLVWRAKRNAIFIAQRMIRS